MNLMIIGDPVPKARARITRSGYAYTPEHTREHEKLVKQTWIDEHGNYAVTLLPVRIVMRFYLPAPQTLQKKDPEGVADETLPGKGRADVDNFAKLVMDALQGLAYQNDSQVYLLHAEKWYSNNPRTEVEVIT